MDSCPLEVSPAVLALRLAPYAARSVLRASKYQVEIQKEILIKTYSIIALIFDRNSTSARIMYALLLLLTTVVSCILLAPGLHDKLKSVPFCKDGDGTKSEGVGNFIESGINSLKDQISGGVEGYQINCSEAVGYLAVYR